MIRWAGHVVPALAKARQGTEALARALEQGLTEADQWMQAEAERAKDEDLRQGLRSMADARRAALGAVRARLGSRPDPRPGTDA